MPECHKCKLAGTSACLTCPGPSERSYKGRTFLELNDATEARAIDTSAPSGPVTDLPEEVEDALRRIVSTIVALSPRELLLAQAIMKGQSLTEAARHFRTSHQALSKRLIRIVRRHPELIFLREIIHGK